MRLDDARDHLRELEKLDAEWDASILRAHTGRASTPLDLSSQLPRMHDLMARLGDTLLVGESSLKLVALVAQEPDAALDYFDVAPKVVLNLADLPATGLVQEGSRIRHRLVVAGDATAVERFVRQVRPALGRGQRLETIQDARPEIRSALDRAGRFLGLAALVSVVLAAVAVAMAARRHSERHLSGSAVMRCLGAQQRIGHVEHRLESEHRLLAEARHPVLVPLQALLIEPAVTPVEPKPPAPRAVSSSVSTSAKAARWTGAGTSCAMRWRSITDWNPSA